MAVCASNHQIRFFITPNIISKQLRANILTIDYHEI